MNTLSWHLRDWVIPWLLVGPGSHLILEYPINTAADIVHGIQKLLFLSDSPSDMAVPESLDDS